MCENLSLVVRYFQLIQWCLRRLWVGEQSSNPAGPPLSPVLITMHTNYACLWTRLFCLSYSHVLGTTVLESCKSTHWRQALNLLQYFPILLELLLCLAINFWISQFLKIWLRNVTATVSVLTHWGWVTYICVFTLQLCKTDDANLRF